MNNAPLSQEDFTLCPWEEVVAGTDEREHWPYFRRFDERAKEALAAGDERCHRVFATLADACSLHLEAGSIDRPLQPWLVARQGRSVAVEDFQDDILTLLAQLVPTVTDAELRARLGDLVWVAKRDHQVARLAVVAYLASARTLEASGAWPEMEERLERAVKLAKTLGRRNQPFADAIAAVEAALDRYDVTNGWKILAAQLMALLLEHDHGDPGRYAALADQAARRALAEGDWHRAETYWRIEARWHRRARDDAARREAERRAAEVHVVEANAALRRGDFIAASMHLERAVAVNREIGERARADELHRDLLRCQARADEQMQTFSQPLDFLEPLEKAAKERVGGKTLAAAVVALARTAPLHEIAELRRSAEERSEEQRVVDLFAASAVVDERGRVVARKPSFLSPDPAVQGEAKRAEMDRAASLHRHVFVHGFVEPARRLIVDEHRVDLRTFAPLVVNNPFVPRGREVIFARGLLAGILGDTMVAAHLLIPQIEHSLRCVHAQLSAATMDAPIAVDENLGLNQMLSERYAATEEILGPEIAFDLRSLLISRFGQNLRNRVAHGQMDLAAFADTQIVYLWWLCLHLCCAGIILRLIDAAAPGGTKVEDECQPSIGDPQAAVG